MTGYLTKGPISPSIFSSQDFKNVAPSYSAKLPWNFAPIRFKISHLIAGSAHSHNTKAERVGEQQAKSETG